MKHKKFAQHLLKFIDASPSPWHAVHSVVDQLSKHQFTQLKESEQWQLKQNGRYFIVRDDSSIIAFVLGKSSLIETGFKIIGAHTDSPGFRVKPKAASLMDNLVRLGVEVYGGPILATFTDRDLSLAGRVTYQTKEGVQSKLINFENPLIRLPNLAIHMNRNVNEEGLKLNKQLELPLLFSSVTEQQLDKHYFVDFLADAAQVKSDKILSWELNVYDTQPGGFWGRNQEFLANGQLDNLASCHAGLLALLDDSVLDSDYTQVCAFFDHEEIGSNTVKGADGSFLSDMLTRIALSVGMNSEDYHRALSKSFVISADMAHAYQPNFPNAYEPEHKVFVNQGPVIKINANRRYASDSISEAMFARWCEQAKIPYQKYAHHSDLPCGSTIGPMTSAKLGLRTVDVGNPMWAMHSARESAGVIDHYYMIEAMKCFFLDESFSWIT